MERIDLQLKAIDALVHIHTVMKQVASADATVVNFIEILYLHLLASIRRDAPSVYGELEKNAELGDNILNRYEDDIISISSLVDILQGLDIRNISFDKDPEKEGLRIFMNLLAKPEPIEIPKESGGFEAEDIKGDVYTDLRPAEKEIEEVLTVEKNIVLPEIELPSASTPGPTEPDFAQKLEPEPEPELESEQVPEPELVPQEASTSAPEFDISESITRIQKVMTRMDALDGAIEAIPSNETMEMVRKLLSRAAQWVEDQTDCTPEFETICHRLQVVLRSLLFNGFFVEANPVLNAFGRISNGTLKKDNRTREIASHALRSLASDENINRLFREINTNENNKAAEACKTFAGFGTAVMEKLLNGLRKASESKDRISILHIIEDMGPAAIPAIRASINMNAPWYYLRNMAYILGRIGNENSADILKPLLTYKDKRVRMEAFKGIVQTGGSKRGQLLLSSLSQVDADMRSHIIDTLGKIKCTEAVAGLNELMKAKSSLSKEEQIATQEKICKALGAIGSPEAVKILSEISESKSFLGLQSYPSEVKYAAKRALDYLKRK